LIISQTRLKTTDLIDCELPNLYYLNISFNQIIDVQLGKYNLNLQILDISHNCVEKLDCLSVCTNLTILRIQNNKIFNIFPLTSLKALKELWISNNNIEWTECLHLKQLPVLEAIVVYGNPLINKPSYDMFIKQVCPSLCFIDGENVKDLCPSDYQKSTDFRGSHARARAVIQNQGSLFNRGRKFGSLSTKTSTAYQSGVVSTDDIAVLNSTEGMDATYSMTADSRIHTEKPKSEQGDIVKLQAEKHLTAKANKRKSKLPKKFLPNPIVHNINISNADGAGGHRNSFDDAHQLVLSRSNLHVLQDSLKPPEEMRSQHRSINSDESLLNPLDPKHIPTIADDNIVNDDMASNRVLYQNVSSVGSGSPVRPGDLSAMRVIRFGESVTSPVAVCLYDDGSGYIRSHHLH